MSTLAVTFVLPDILFNFPLPRNLSKHHKVTKDESNTWCQSFRLLEGDRLKGFNMCDFGLLSALVYSPRDKDIIRLGCDLINLLYVYDEYTDISDGNTAMRIREIVMDALRNPDKERPEGELTLGRMTRDFWIRACNLVSPGAMCIRHFVNNFDAYTAAVVHEAEERVKDASEMKTFEEYLALRRDTSACLPAFALCEFGLDLPEQVYHHPSLNAVREQALCLVLIINDIYSYAMENSRGLDRHNSVTVIMNERKLDLQGAIDWLGQYGESILAGFLDSAANIPSWGEDVDGRVKIYVNGLAQWVRGNDDWSFESHRYFGSNGLRIKTTRVMTLHRYPINWGLAKSNPFCYFVRLYEYISGLKFFSRNN